MTRDELLEVLRAGVEEYDLQANVQEALIFIVENEYTGRNTDLDHIIEEIANAPADTPVLDFIEDLIYDTYYDKDEWNRFYRWNFTEMLERLEELQNMTPGDAWEIFVGSQSVYEFVEIYMDQGFTDFGDMVDDYTGGLNAIFNEDAPYSETEKKIIHDKLLKYIECVMD